MKPGDHPDPLDRLSGRYFCQYPSNSTDYFNCGSSRPKRTVDLHSGAES
jgi:hypothetical protein